MPFFCCGQNSLYIAPGPPKWVNLGDLDVIGNKLTIEALITGISGGSKLNIISKHNDTTNVNYLLRPGSFGISTSNGYYYVINPLYPLLLNTPYHVAVTYDGAQLRYYVNGCLVNSTQCSGNMITNNLNTAVGNQSTNQIEPFTGYIDELRIWNTARTQSEIQANMNTLSNPTSQTGLIAYYNFDTDYNNIQGDATRNGTLMGSPQRIPNPYWNGGINNLAVSAVATDNVCYNGTEGILTATATGAFSPYSYSIDGINYQSSSTFNNLATGIYNIYAKTNASCIDTTNITINQPPKIVIAATQIFAPCDSFATVTASAIGGTGSFYNFQWNTIPIQTSASGTGLAAGTYTISATDQANCTDSNTFTVIISTPLSVDFNVIDYPCPGECNGTVSSLASGGNSPYSYQWESGLDSSVATNLCSDSFDVTITDANGCIISDTILLSQAQPISATIISENSNCGQPDGSASITNPFGGGTPGTYIYQWDSSAGNQTSFAATGLSDGVYFVTITSGFCDTVFSATVGFNAPPTATAAGDSARCFNECNGTGTITAIGGPAPATFTYLWDNGETSQTATALCAGNHSVTATDSTGCNANVSVIIFQPDSLIATIPGDGDTSICISGAVTLSASAIGGTIPYAFLWNNGLNTAGPIFVNPVSATCYEVTVNDVKGCFAKSSLYCANIYPPLNVSSLSNDTICEGNTIIIGANATGGHPDSTITYNWSTGQTNDTITVNPTTYPLPAYYTVVAGEGCSPNDSVIIEINYFITPSVSFTSDTDNGCMPLTVFFANTTPNIISCQWNFSDGNFSTSFNTINTFRDTGSFNVTLMVVSSDSCPADTTFNNYIRVNPLPPANAGNDTIIYQESTIQLNAAGGLDYMWDTGENTQTITVSPAQTTTYFVSVTDAAGCVSFGEVTVTVDFKYVIFVPTMFSPNNDGINDILYVRGLGISNFKLQIFNRWGEKVFETTDKTIGWDGKLRGLELNPDVFVFLLQANMDNGEAINRNGNITLIK